MIGKLCKYEFKSILRTLTPIYIAVLAVSLIFSIAIGIDFGTDIYSSLQGQGFLGDIYSLIQMALGLMYFAVMVALFVITAIIIIQRFYKGLLCDEGYLMFTLPVKPWHLIASKGIVAFVVSILSSIISMISVFMLIVGAASNKLEFFSVIFNFGEWSRVFSILTNIYPAWWLFIVEFILLCIIGAMASLYQIYASMAIGHIAGKHRIMMSVVAYIVISIILSFVGGFIMMFVMNPIAENIMVYADASQMGVYGINFLHIFMIINIFISIIEFIVFFFITERILSRKLNLE